MDEITLKKIVNYASLKYSPQKICLLLDLDHEQTEQFLIEYNNLGSVIRHHYDRGVTIGEFNVDAALAKQAENGDILSITEQATRQYRTKINDLKKELFNL